MPGRIESVPFLSQIEDVEKYLREYRSLKLTSPSHSGSYNNTTAVGQQQQVNGQLRFNQNASVKVSNEAREGNVANKTGLNAKALPAGGYNDSTAMVGGYVKNMNGVNFNGSMIANRKKYAGNGNQNYRYNSHSNSNYGAQYQAGVQMQPKSQQQTGFAQNSMIASHFKQVYPQMSYNCDGGSSSNLALGSSFMMSKASPVQQGYPSGASSPSPAPPRVDTSLSGTSSVSSYNDHVMTSNSNSANGQFSGTHGQFQNYLDSGLVSSSSIASGISSHTNIYNLANGDGAAGYASTALATERSNANGTPMNFESAMATPVMVPEPISSERAAGEVGLRGFEAPIASMTNSSSNLLMNDYSVGWGSNHANTSSNTSGAFGIWNSDMSVWS